MKNKLRKIILLIFTTITTMNSYASIAINPKLLKARAAVVKQYIHDLEQADYQDIATLFIDNGIVISTSQDQVNAHDFFYSFLPNEINSRQKYKA